MGRNINVSGQTGDELFTSTNPGNVALTGRNAADAQTLWTPGMLYNETTSDKPRGNTQGTLLASAARTANLFSQNITNYNARGMILTIGITAISGAGATLTPQICDGNAVPYAPGGTALTAIGNYKYVLYPAPITAPANSAGFAQLPLGRLWQAYFGITGTTPNITFSVTYELIL